MNDNKKIFTKEELKALVNKEGDNKIDCNGGVNRKVGKEEKRTFTKEELKEYVKNKKK